MDGYMRFQAPKRRIFKSTLEHRMDHAKLQRLFRPVTSSGRGLKVREAARYWGCSLNAMREMINNKDVPSYPVKPGSSHRRVWSPELDRLRSRLTAQGVPRQIRQESNADRRGVSDIDGKTFFQTMFPESRRRSR